MKQLMISLLLLLTCFSVQAQEKTANQEVTKVKKLYALYGGTYDSFTRMPLGAKVFLMLKDSTIVDTLSAEVYNKDSFFKFPVEKVRRDYILKATYPGYFDTSINYTFEPKGRKYNNALPKILMKRDNQNYEAQLDEVVVKATKIQVVHRGDTIVYDATAFAMPEGSMLDALIKQLPGVEL